MSSRITTISLDDHTHAIKEKMGGNFSKFVRTCLRRYEAHHHEGICMFERKIKAGVMEESVLVGGLCVPLGSNFCNKHWPNGRPKMEDWKQYREMLLCLDDPRRAHKLTSYWPAMENYATPQDWIQDMATIQNTDLFEIADIDLKGNKKKEPKVKVRKSFISKMLNFL